MFSASNNDKELSEHWEQLCKLCCESIWHVQWAGGKSRTCEDLKERYYKVARSLQVAWEGTEEGAANLTLIKYPFNAQHERWGAPSLLLRLSHAPANLSMVLYKGK